MIDRRAFLSGLAATATLAIATAGCARKEGTEGVVRVGFIPNLTHAPLIVGLASGRFATALPGIRFEVRTFRSGPRVTEALLGSAIDVGVSGPGAIVSMHSRHSGNPMQILAGCASGGASLVALPFVREPRDLRGRRVATPQIGSTQDISLRKYLRAHGLDARERGGDVIVDAMAAANILAQMRAKEIVAAWLPEPWATRVVSEAGAWRMLDERELWPQHRFPAALFVVRREFARARRREVEALTAALDVEVRRIGSDERSTQDVVLSEIERLTGKGLPRTLLEEAWTKVDFTSAPLAEGVAQIARDAKALGYLPNDDTSGLFVS